MGNITCEQLHFHVLVRRGQELLGIRAWEREEGCIKKKILLDRQESRSGKSEGVQTLEAG